MTVYLRFGPSSKGLLLANRGFKWSGNILLCAFCVLGSSFPACSKVKEVTTLVSSVRNSGFCFWIFEALIDCILQPKGLRFQ